MHTGHRQRMYDKFDEAPHILCDHEILEMFLYRCYARSDTNPIAHRLLDSFGGLKGVFSARVDELCGVEGVGLATARAIAVAGELYARIQKENTQSLRLNTIEGVRKAAEKYFRDLKRECLVVFLLDGNFSLKFTKKFEGELVNQVKFKPKEINELLVAHKPKGIIVAHNHPSGNKEPSEQDDEATEMLYNICRWNDVSLFDHVIFAGEETYSYNNEHRLERIKEKYKSK